MIYGMDIPPRILYTLTHACRLYFILNLLHDVTTFWMGQSVHCLSVDDNSHSNSSAHRDVHKRIFHIMITQFKLSKGTRVHISVNFNFVVI